GCGMACPFCATGQGGLQRNLSAAEILAQVLAGARTLADGQIPGGPGRINNIVFMGMGEPMDNFDAVLDAVEVLTDHHGASIPMSKITISTVGRIDGLRRLAERFTRPGWKRLGLAISVNAPNDEIRSELMPINRGMPMAELREALLALPIMPTRKLCFEYVLIPGVNDADEHAQQLADYLRPWASAVDRPVPRGLVNVIPYNPRRDSPWPAPEEDSVDRFMDLLIEQGLFVKRRRTKGRTAMAACGQLGAAHIRKRRYVTLSTPSGDA
ncbi:MAG: radical SAM protein, partial [Salinibacterium sp.]|nr:radical SAM protein [Salinibacterium sp.]